jgi:hypothetical protein
VSWAYLKRHLQHYTGHCAEAKSRLFQEVQSKPQNFEGYTTVLLRGLSRSSKFSAIFVATRCARFSHQAKVFQFLPEALSDLRENVAFRLFSAEVGITFVRLERMYQLIGHHSGSPSAATILLQSRMPSVICPGF